MLRVVPNLSTDDPAKLAQFYTSIFGCDVLMNMGWIVTLGTDQTAKAQLSVMSEGGSGTAVPNLSIEVDSLDAIVAACQSNNINIEYGPVVEPWGVRRLYLRDPAGHLVNVLCHVS